MKDCNRNIAYLDSVEQKDDPELFIHGMMQWHFNKETGTDFWLGLAKELDFDPVRDVKTFRDLKKFPDISARLRTLPVGMLIPNGLKNTLIPNVYESGGTSGEAKFIVAYDEWINKLVNWRVASYQNRPGRPSGNTLAVVPTGPHIVGAINRVRAQRLGGLCFTVDLDPRWVKRLIHGGYYTEAARYTAHVVGQIEHIAQTQDIRFLVTTPPLLREIVKTTPVLERLRQTLAHVTLGGTELNLDEIQFMAEDVLPGCEFSASYGSTSALGDARSELITSDSVRIAYTSFSPFTTYDIVDPDSHCSLDEGERGTVVVSHVSRYAFYPQVFERDHATKLPPGPHMVGACIADIAPEPVVNGRKVVEGVY